MTAKLLEGMTMLQLPVPLRGVPMRGEEGLSPITSLKMYP